MPNFCDKSYLRVSECEARDLPGQYEGSAYQEIELCQHNPSMLARELHIKIWRDFPLQTIWVLVSHEAQIRSPRLIRACPFAEFEISADAIEHDTDHPNNPNSPNNPNTLAALTALITLTPMSSKLKPFPNADRVNERLVYLVFLTE